MSEVDRTTSPNRAASFIADLQERDRKVTTMYEAMRTVSSLARELGMEREVAGELREVADTLASERDFREQESKEF